MLLGTIVGGGNGIAVANAADIGFSARMPSSSAIDTLLLQRTRFRNFLISRLGSESEADDRLQNSLIKALRTADAVRDDEKLIPWFYRVLRRAIIDHARSSHSARARNEAWAAQVAIEGDREAEENICGCFEALLPALKPREANLLRRIDMQDESVADVTNTLGITANNASVALHRARRALRKQLEAFCGSCARTACLDCACDSPSDHGNG